MQKGRLWIDGNGRITCDRIHCAGQTAVASGMRYDLNGAELLEITADILPLLDSDPQCENCHAKIN